MTKLFITLNMLLAVTVFSFIWQGNAIVESLLSQPKKALYDNTGKGTLYLLNQAMEGLPVEQRNAKLVELEKQFAYSLKLQKIDKKAFSQQQIKRLREGHIELKEIDSADHLYGLLAGTDLVWNIPIDISNEQDLRNSWSGTFYLIEQALLAYKKSERHQAMQGLKAHFGIDIALLSVSEVTLPTKQQSQLNRGLIAIENLGDDDNEMFYKKMPDSEQVIFIGKMPYPWIKSFISPIMIGILLLIVGLTTFFWVWTLWKDISRIRDAAGRFGAGNHDVRVPYNKTARLAQLSQAFNSMAEQTQSSIRSHKELTSAVSHELRTPVARMRFSLDMLEESNNSEDRKRYVSNMNTDMDELDLLLNELLTYARFDQGENRLKLQRLSLVEWLESSMHNMKGLAPDTQLDWTVKENVKELASFDPVLMSRLLSNLVQNAVRYANTRVLVSLSHTKQGHQICVEDDGLGIPESDRERLFEAFATRNSSRNKSTEGFGLGLAIVKRIVEAHKGVVEIHDSPLGGAQFCARWPRNLTIEKENAA